MLSTPWGVLDTAMLARCFSVSQHESEYFFHPMSLPKMGKLKLDQDRHAFLEKLNENMFMKADMISACS